MAQSNNQLRTIDYSERYPMNDEEFDSITDVPVDEQFLAALREAGASRLCRNIVQIDPEEAGVSRNSVRLELQKYCYWADEVSAEAIEDKLGYGGHFFQAVWEGDFQKARGRADMNNQRILDETNSTALTV